MIYTPGIEFCIFILFNNICVPLSLKHSKYTAPTGFGYNFAFMAYFVRYALYFTDSRSTTSTWGIHNVQANHHMKI